MPRNTLGDLNNHLFAQLERLSDEDIKGNALEEEINRAKAVTSIAQQWDLSFKIKRATNRILQR